MVIMRLGCHCSCRAFDEHMAWHGCHSNQFISKCLKYIYADFEPPIREGWATISNLLLNKMEKCNCPADSSDSSVLRSLLWKLITSLVYFVQKSFDEKQINQKKIGLESRKLSWIAKKNENFPNFSDEEKKNLRKNVKVKEKLKTFYLCFCNQTNQLSHGD